MTIPSRTTYVCVDTFVQKQGRLKKASLQDVLDGTSAASLCDLLKPRVARCQYTKKRFIHGLGGKKRPWYILKSSERWPCFHIPYAARVLRLQLATVPFWVAISSATGLPKGSF